MWLSIQGIYEYDNTVFDGFDAPSYTDDNNVVHTLNRDDVINNILLQCAELELVYPSVQMMKFAIGVWSASNLRTWDKLYKSMFLEYNPIWNLDTNETETETNERDINRQHTGSNNETLNLSDAETRNLTDAQTVNLTDTETRDLEDTKTFNLSDAETRNLSDAETVNLTDTESVQGFNSNSWSEAKKLVKTGTDTTNHTGTDTILHTGTETTEYTGTDTIRKSGTDTTNHTGTDTILHTGTDNTAITNNETVSDDNDRTLTKRRTGNQGVSTTQSMIREERDIAEFSIIEYITQSFKERFCLLVY